MTAEDAIPLDTKRSTAVPAAPAGMPLAARRLLLIGALCVPVGLVAGPYWIGAQLLAVAGVVMVAVALSYSAGVSWFSRWSWAVAAAGILWLAATASYLAAIVVAADSNTPTPGFAPVLFNIGGGLFVVMAGAAVAAMTRRMVTSRQQATGPGMVPPG